MVHVRATLYASIVILVTNLVLVVWVLALRGGRLWAPRRQAQRAIETAWNRSDRFPRVRRKRQQDAGENLQSERQAAAGHAQAELDIS